jgi:hypothetical protein
MEDNKTVIILLCVIIAILIVGVVMFSPLMAKEKSNLAISDKELNVGDSLTVTLSDDDGVAMANQTVKIRLTDKDGITIDEDITTDSKGKAKLKVDEKGKYSVECKFDGDGKYASSSTAANLTVKKATTEVVNEDKTSDSVSALSDSEREEYKITPDGWNPREHEVSREPIGNGNERVNYDDGYMRVVDQDGNILSHGWG